MPNDRPWPTPPTARRDGVRPELDYMTAAERQTFRAYRDTGRVTVFRVQECRRCGAEVPRPKLYCSKECMMEHENKEIAPDERDMGETTPEEKRAAMEEVRIVKLANSYIGQRVILETKDGMRRHGALTHVTTNSLLLGDRWVHWPKGVVLNGDKTDEIPWDSLAWLRVENDAFTNPRGH